MAHIGIIGAGAWGTALASVAARAGTDPLIWGREAEVVDAINTQHENTSYLSGIRIPPTIRATDSLEATYTCDALLLVVPCQYLRGTLAQMKNLELPKTIPLVLCSKGVEASSLELMSEVVSGMVSNPLSILSGPSFASEVALGLPTSVTLACNDIDYAKRDLVPLLAHTGFKIRLTDDLIGAEIGGAVKNVIAIACGMAQGKRLGRNATAAIITQGLREMAVLCQAKGGRSDTLMELCGVGDLILTCNSQESRNMSLGFQLGEGRTLDEVMHGRHSVAEGVSTSLSITKLASKLDIDLPLCKLVSRILHEDAPIDDTIEALVRVS